MFAVFLVAVAEEPEGEDGHQNEDRVTQLAATLPRRNLPRVRLSVQIVNAAVQPVTVRIHMEFFIVFELVKRVVFEVVGLNLVIFGGFWLVFVPVLSG